MLKMTFTDFGEVRTMNTAEKEVLNCFKSCQELYFILMFHHFTLFLCMFGSFSTDLLG